MRKYILAGILLLVLPLSLLAQADRHEVRAGNRKFRKGDFKAAEIDYRKAVLKDTASVAGQYDLASSLYRQEDYASAAQALAAIKEAAPATPHAADYFYNAGDVALQQKDYKAAVEAFMQSLLLRPEDLDAKENYLYAKKMLENEQQNGGGGQDNQDQDQDQNQDQNQDQQNQDQNQQNQDQQQDQGGSQPQESKISPQQAQQMIQAIQAKEKETQDKVNKEKAALLKSRQREKNW
ncbi:MAG: tetratricopeptide repeat protein [Bacteroidales bacterium]|nr:tetratricopeptide repeat protein [Bacteroidales bacterium]